MKQKEIPFSIPFINEREIKEVVKVLKGKWITTGSEVKRFEERVREYLDVSTAVAVSSGTAAMEIALAVNGVGPGDEVLTTAYTFASTVIVILHRGADAVLVDVEDKTFNIDAGKIETEIKENYEMKEDGLVSKKSKKRLKGIIAVHFGGQSADMKTINRIAEKYNLFVLEDAAHAIGAVHHGIKTGKSRNFVCFSFYSNKNLTTGEGGMIVTDKNENEQKLRMYSLHGISKSAIERYKNGLPFYDIVFPGYKANLTDIQAALGVIQMEKLERITELRNRVASWYNHYFKDVEEISTPFIKEYNKSARHLYPILISPSLRHRRDDFIVDMRSKNIYPSVHFIPVHFHSFYKNFVNLDGKIHLPVTEDLFSREISLPIFPGIKKSEVKYIVDVIKDSIIKFR